MIALDTTAIIDIFKGEEDIKKVLGGIKDEFVTTLINYQEILFGLDLNDQGYKREIGYYDDFFQEVNILLHDKETAKEASKIFWNLKKQGRSIGRFDCMIIGILLHNGVNKIITRNVKHFENIKELKIITY